MTEYVVLLAGGTERVIITADNFNHAVSEALDEFGGWANVRGIWPAPVPLKGEPYDFSNDSAESMAIEAKPGIYD